MNSPPRSLGVSIIEICYVQEIFWIYEIKKTRDLVRQFCHAFLISIQKKSYTASEHNKINRLKLRHRSTTYRTSFWQLLQMGHHMDLLMQLLTSCLTRPHRSCRGHVPILWCPSIMMSHISLLCPRVYHSFRWSSYD